MRRYESIDWSNREQVLEAVSKQGGTLAFASDTLTRDRVVALRAVQQDGYALQFAGDPELDNSEPDAAAAAADGSDLEGADDDAEGGRGNEYVEHSLSRPPAGWLGLVLSKHARC